VRRRKYVLPVATLIVAFGVILAAFTLGTWVRGERCMACRLSVDGVSKTGDVYAGPGYGDWILYVDEDPYLVTFTIDKPLVSVSNPFWPGRLGSKLFADELPEGMTAGVEPAGDWNASVQFDQSTGEVKFKTLDGKQIVFNSD
jgi:hypothetical protein